MLARLEECPMPESIHGRCLCGAIEIELTPPTEFCSHCHICGTSMVCYYTEESLRFGNLAGKMYVPVAVLTDPLDKVPEGHVSFEEQVGWFSFDDGLPRYRGKSEERLG